MEKVAQQLQDILKTSGFTQTELAARFEVSFVTLNSWLYGRSLPRAKAREKIKALYQSLTVQKGVPETLLAEKRRLIAAKSKSLPHPLRTILSRPDLTDQFLLSLTYHTNRIEGSTLTEKETADILFENAVIPRKTLTEQLEAKNHQTALKYLFETVSQNKNFSMTEAFILKLHAILMNGILDDAGRYRDHGVRIVGSHVPTTNPASVPQKTKAFVNQLNQKTGPIILHLAKTHASFEQIHPFSDGNGRIGRLILHAQALSHNFPPVLIENSRKRLYLAYLEKAQLENKFKLLEDFLCNAILESYRLIEES